MSETLLTLLDTQNIKNKLIFDLICNPSQELQEADRVFKKEILSQLKYLKNNCLTNLTNPNEEHFIELVYEDSWWLDNNKNQIKRNTFDEANTLNYFSLIRLKCLSFDMEITGFPEKPGICVISFPAPHLFYESSKFRDYYRKSVKNIAKKLKSHFSLYFRSNGAVYNSYTDLCDLYEFADGTSGPLNDFAKYLVDNKFLLLDHNKSFNEMNYETEMSGYFFEEFS